jgi:hypothetical protein
VKPATTTVVLRRARSMADGGRNGECTLTLARLAQLEGGQGRGGCGGALCGQNRAEAR